MQATQNGQFGSQKSKDNYQRRQTGSNLSSHSTMVKNITYRVSFIITLLIFRVHQKTVLILYFSFMSFLYDHLLPGSLKTMSNQFRFIFVIFGLTSFLRVAQRGHKANYKLLKKNVTN